MKRGDKVAICWDGKWGRREPGVIVRNKNGHHILVRFAQWDDDDKLVEVEAWFRKTRRRRRWGGAGYRYEGYGNDNAGTRIAGFHSIYKWKQSEPFASHVYFEP